MLKGAGRSVTNRKGTPLGQDLRRGRPGERRENTLRPGRSSHSTRKSVDIAPRFNPLTGSQVDSWQCQLHQDLECPAQSSGVGDLLVEARLKQHASMLEVGNKCPFPPSFLPSFLPLPKIVVSVGWYARRQSQFLLLFFFFLTCRCRSMSCHTYCCCLSGGATIFGSLCAAHTVAW